MKLTTTIMLAGAMLVAAPAAMSTSAMARECPLVAGDYTSLSDIFIQDGGTLA